MAKKNKNPLDDFTTKIETSIGNVPNRQIPNTTVAPSPEEISRGSRNARDNPLPSNTTETTYNSNINDILKLPEDKKQETSPSNQKKSTDIQPTFNKDGTVTVTVNGQRKTLSKEDYNQSQGMGTGGKSNKPTTITQEAQQIRDAQKGVQQIDTSLMGQIGNIGADNAQGRLITGGELGVGAGVSALSGLTGAGAGALAGSLFAPVTAGASIPAGALIGAGIGAVGGLISGAVFQIGKNEKGNVAEAFTTYKKAKYNMSKYQSFVNKGVMTPQQAVIAWNQELINIRQAKATIRQANSNSINKFLSGGAQEMADIESFERLLPSLNSAFASSLVNPTGQEVNFGVDLTEFQ